MKNGFKRVVAMLLTVVLLLTAAPLSGFVGIELPNFNFGALKAQAAEEPVHTGNCGDLSSSILGKDMTYHYENHVLTISGVGEMRNYTRLAPAPWYDYRESIQTVVFSKTPANIGSYAFYDCYKLTSITITNSVTGIANNAFEDCDGLTNITIPNSVTVIEPNAFNDCDGLTNITIPNSVTGIEYNVFNSCDNLETVVLPSTLKWIGESSFESCGKLKNINLVNGMTSIGRLAFKSCSSLKEITIPEGITIINPSTFNSCIGLEKVILPNSLITIDIAAFSSCKLLESVSFTSESGAVPALKTIGNTAFLGCSSLSNIYIPEGVTTLGLMSFFGVKANKIILPSSVTTIGNDFASSTETTTYTSGEVTTATNPIRIFGTDAQYQIIANNSITKHYLYSFVVLNNLEEYGYCGDTGAHDTMMWFIEGDTLYVHGSGRMADYLPKRFNELIIALLAVRGFMQLLKQPTDEIDRAIAQVNSVYNKDEPINDQLSPWNNEDIVSAEIRAGIKKLIVSGSIEYIGRCAFNLLDITSADFSGNSGLTQIGTGAFQECSALTSFDVPSSVSVIDNCAFQSSGLSTLSFDPNGNIKTIGPNAFEHTAITAVTIPAGVRYIESKAFSASLLNSVTFLDGKYGPNADGGSTDFSQYAFEGAPISSVLCARDSVPYYNAQKFIETESSQFTDIVHCYQTSIETATAKLAGEPENVLEGEYFINKAFGRDSDEFKIDISIGNYEDTTITEVYLIQPSGELKSEQIASLISSGSSDIIAEIKDERLTDLEINLRFSVQRQSFLLNRTVYACAKIVKADNTVKYILRALNIGVFTSAITSLGLATDATIPIAFSGAFETELDLSEVLEKFEQNIFKGKSHLGAKVEWEAEEDGSKLTAGLSVNIKKEIPGVPSSGEVELIVSLSGSPKFKYNLNTKQMYIAEGELSLKITVKGKHSCQLPTALPLVAILEVEASGAAIVTLDVETIQAAITGTVEATLKASLNLGNAKIYAGIYGSATAKFKIPYEEPEISGEIGVHYSVFGVLKGEYVLFPKVEKPMKNGTTISEDITNNIDFEFDIPENVEPPRMMLANEKPVDTSIAGTSLSDFSYNCYEYTETKLVVCNGKPMLFFIGVIMEDDYNYRTLMYSVYDATTGWSNPSSVYTMAENENRTNDNQFEVCSYGANAYVAFTKANRVFDGNTTMEQIAKSYEVYGAVVNENGSHTSKITNDNLYDSDVSISVIETRPTIAWAGISEFDNDNPFGVAGTYYLCTSTLNAETTDSDSVLASAEWSVKTSPLCESMPMINSLDIGTLNSTGYIAITVDGDNNVFTFDDTSLHLVSFDGAQKCIDTFTDTTLNAKFISYDGHSTLVWYDGGIISCLTSAQAAPGRLLDESLDNTIPYDFHFVDCADGRSALFYSVNEESGSRLYTLYRVNGEWGLPFALTDPCEPNGRTYSNIGDCDVIYYDGKFVVPMTIVSAQFKTVNNQTDLDVNSTTFSILSYSPTDSLDFTVTSVDQQTKTVTALIQNTGVKKAENLKFTVSNSASFSQTIPVLDSLESGDSAQVTFAVSNLPEVITGENSDSANKYDLKLFSTQNSAGISKNCSLYFPDLEMSAKQVGASSDLKMIELTVTNSGKLPSTAIDNFTMLAGEETVDIAIDRETLVMTTETTSGESGAKSGGETMFAATEKQLILNPGDTITYLYTINTVGDGKTVMYTGELEKVTFGVQTYSTELEVDDNRSEVIFVDFDTAAEVSLSADRLTFNKSMPREHVVTSNCEITNVTYNSSSPVKGFPYNYSLTQNGKITVDGGKATLTVSFLSALDKGEHILDFQLYQRTTDSTVCKQLTITVIDSGFTIIGTPCYGETLSTDAQLGCYNRIEWYADSVKVYEDDTLELTNESYIGKTVYAKLFINQGDEGQISNSVLIEKVKSMPDLITAPVVVSVTSSSVTLKAFDGYEYKINNGEWTLGTTFTGLNRDTVYNITMRKAATNTEKPGPTKTCQATTLHSHVYDIPSSWIIEPTCISGGTRNFACNCGDIQPRAVNAYGHNLSHLKNSPTCTEQGKTYDYCSRCHEEFAVIPIPALGHDKIPHTVNPSCTYAGRTYNTCSRCTATLDIVIIPALGHNYELIVTPATCDATGASRQVCQKCGNVINYTTIPSTGHFLVHHINEPSCTASGKSYDLCSVCNKQYNATYLSPLGHSYIDYIYNNNATCTANGTETAACSREGCMTTHTREKAETMLPHSYTQSLITQEPTCTAQGIRTFRCDSCPASYTEPIEALGHRYINYIYNNDATCTADGTETASCSGEGCTETDTRTSAGTMLAHDYEATVEKAATCTKNGIERYTCKNCPAFYTEPILAIGHDFTNYIYNNNETCTADGTESSGCSRSGCTAVDTRTKPNTMLPHNYELVRRELIDCIEGGTDYMQCIDCGKEDNVAVSFTSHDYTVTVITQPTCYSLGNQKLVCKRCTEQRNEDIAKTPHTYGGYYLGARETDGEIVNCRSCTVCTYSEFAALAANWTAAYTTHSYLSIVTPSSCTTDGITRYYCPHCDKWLPEQITYTEADVNIGCTSYSSWENKTWSFESENAIASLTIKFSSASSLDDASDYLYVYDLNDNMIKRFSSGFFFPSPAGATVTVPGRGFKVVLKTNLLGNEGGFSITQVTANADFKPIEAHHAFRYTIKSQPTCTTTGTRDALCLLCAKTLTDDVIPVLGHDIRTTNTVKPGCETFGIDTETCARPGCNYVHEIRVEPRGHSYSVTTDRSATCTAQGSTKFTCTNSGCDDIKYEPIAPLGHKYTSSIVNSPSCTTEGSKKLTCTRTDCGDVKYESIAPLGHNLYRTLSVAATCTAGGGDKKICSRCDYTEFRQTSESTPHYDRNSDGKCDTCGLTLSDICSCNCHQTSGFKKFIYLISRFFWKLFGKNEYCGCGNSHY